MVPEVLHLTRYDSPGVKREIDVLVSKLVAYEPHRMRDPSSGEWVEVGTKLWTTYSLPLLVVNESITEIRAKLWGEIACTTIS